MKIWAVIAVELTSSAGLETPAQGETTGYGAFKLAEVATHCIVPRIAENAPAGAVATVGPAGGEVITDDKAVEAHLCAKSAMVAAYSGSGDTAAREYSRWTVNSTAPYVSTTHGNRYVNNYANQAASEYGKFEAGAQLPVGPKLAKSSFVVNVKRQVVIGVLSLMKKMEPGFNPDFGNWRYTTILPDGEVVGTTGGAGSEKVAFCALCHVAMDESQGRCSSYHVNTGISGGNPRGRADRFSVRPSPLHAP